MSGDPRDVFFEIEGLEEKGNCGHVERATLGVGGHFQQRELFDHRRGGDHPARPEPGGEDLREAADVDDALVGIGDHIDQFRVSLARELRLEVFHLHSFLVYADGGITRLIRVERDQRSEEGRILGHDEVTRVDEELGGEVESLLRTLDDQHVLRRARDALPRDPDTRPRMK